MDFILIFQIFFGINSFKKKAKQLDLSHETCGADVAHGGHVARPRKPTWMLAWRLRAVNSNVLADDGPMG